MRKFYLLLVLQLLSFQGLLWSQVKLTVELQSDSITYVVKLRPDMSYVAPMNTTNNAQISFAVPAGGFKVGPVTNIKGLWSEASTVVAPTESPTTDYLMFNLQSGTPDIDYTANQEVELFSFQNTGTCTGALNFVLEDDPFFPPNSQSINIGNQISVLGAGFTNAFSGTYGSPANCMAITMPTDSLTINENVITIDSIQVSSPSDCGLTDGSIAIFAKHQDDNTLQYSVDGGATWADESVISNLQSGVSYDVRVRDNIGLNFAEFGVTTLDPPSLASIIKIEANTPACEDSTGSIIIEAENIINTSLLQFSIDDGVTFQDSVGVFQNLPAGAYQPIIQSTGSTCTDVLDPILLIADPCTEGEGEGGEGEESGSGAGSSTGQNNGEGEEEGAEGSGEFIDSVGFTFSNEMTCPFAFVLNAENGLFTVSLLSDTTLSFPSNITSTAQIVVKAPTGGFTVDSLTNLVSGVVFSDNSRSDAPAEAPDFDYISFGLDTRGTQAITYEKGVKVPLFSFKNSATCTDGSVTLMDNATDPFLNNSSNANVNQQITVSGTGSDAEVCVSSLSISDCGMETMSTDVVITTPTDTMTTMPTDTMTTPTDPMEVDELEGIVTDSVLVTISIDETTTLCLDSLVNLDTIVSASLCSQTDDLTVTPDNTNACIEIVPQENFSSGAEICVIHCNNANQCDTTIISICPKVSLGDDLNICEGETVKLNPRGAGSTNQWTTTGNISCADCLQPDISPTASANYILSTTTTSGCLSTDTLFVTVNKAAVIDSILQVDPTDCMNNGSITIQLPDSVSDEQYSIDNGQTFQDNSLFENLSQGAYQVQIRTSNNCTLPTARAIELQGDAPFNIDSVLIANPNTCKNELGSIMVMLTADSTTRPEYSIDSGATWVNRANFDSLALGTYHLLIRTPDSSCTIGYQNNPIELIMPEAARVIDGLNDRSFCEDEAKNIRLTLSEPISDFDIAGSNFMNASTQDSLLSFEAVLMGDTASYTVTLTGASGCSTTSDIKVSTRSCEAIASCDFFNGLDTLRAVIEDSLAVVCLPISDVDIEEFEFLKDGEIYDIEFGECNDASIFYGFNAMSLGTPPFLLQEWIVNGDTLQDFEFSTAEELVNKLNEFDQEANWVMADDFGFIGISGDNNYGPLKLLHIASNTTLELQLNNMNIAFQSLMLKERGVQTFIVRDTMMGCQDSLIVKIDGTMTMDDDSMNMVTTLIPMDTLKLTTALNTPLLNQCLTNSSTIIDSVSTRECENPMNGFLLLQDNNCFNYTPNSGFIGQDSFCLVVCSPAMCDSTFIIVTIGTGNSDSLEVFNAFSPNNDDVNDAFTINNIENFPDNELQIFNRWGNRVYHQEAYNNDWEGTFDNDLLLPDGVYFYLLEVVVEGEPQTHSGYLQIIR